VKIESHDKFLQEQIEYYRLRATNTTNGFFVRAATTGPELNQRWFSEIENLRKAVDKFNPSGDILELACGTGIWTEYLLRFGGRITAVDAAPEVIAINRERTKSAGVKYLQADLFNWQPDKKYDVVFFAFWLSHVPPERFDSFWQVVAGALKPEGGSFSSIPASSRHRRPKTIR